VGKVTAQLKTEGYRGPVEKAITVRSSDPAKSIVNLRLKANVVGSVDVLPRAYVGLPSAPQWEYETKLLVRKDATEKGELAITEFTTSVPWLKGKVRKVENPEPEAPGLPAAKPGDYVLDLALADETPAGQSAQNIRFKTALPREPVVSIPVIVAILQPIQTMPTSLVSNPPPDAAEVSMPFTAVLRPGLAKESFKAEVSPASFEVKVEPDGARRFKGTVTWKKKDGAPEKEGKLVLSASGQDVTIPVRVIERAVRAQAPAGAAPPKAPGQPGTQPASPVPSPAPSPQVPPPATGQAQQPAPAPAQSGTPVPAPPKTGP